MKTTELNIKGMHCKSCVMLLKDTLSETEGVKNADVSLEKNSAKITFDEKKVKPEQFVKLIKAEGYDASVKK
jgi:copper chaperone CopZ